MGYLSRRELHTLMRKRQNLAGIVQATWDYAGRGPYASLRAVQRITEITALAQLVQQTNPKVIVEIGTNQGGTLFIWVRTNPMLEMVVSIDLPGGQFGGGYDARRIRQYREFAVDRPHTCMDFLRVDSHAASSVNALMQVLGNRTIDFLFIDGDHTYQGVKMDFEMYSPLVRKGGLIAFHDIVTCGSGCEVNRFWNDIKSVSRHEEFMEGPQSNMGIGVLYV